MTLNCLSTLFYTKRSISFSLNLYLPKRIYAFSTNKGFDPARACLNQYSSQRLTAEQIKLILKYDIKNNFRHYSYVKTLFQQALLSKNCFGKQQSNLRKGGKKIDENLQETMRLISEYPKFSIKKQALSQLYLLVCFNMHMRPSSFLQACLLATNKLDSKAFNSPIFIEWVKFYLNDSFQIINCEYSIDLTKETIGSSIKLLLFRAFQKGIFSKKPKYQRTLFIKNLEKVLLNLTENPSTAKSKMVRKVNYELFMKFKSFFEQQMKQNLYHCKNLELLSQLSEISKNLIFQENGKAETENQNKYLRQLYIKLFLVIQDPPLKGIIFMYKFCKEHIQKSLAQTKNSIESDQSSNVLINDFLMKVQSLFSCFKLESLEQSTFTLQQKLEILKSAKDLQLQEQFMALLIERISYELAPITCSIHFDSILQIARLLKSSSKDFIMQRLTKKFNEDSRILAQMSLSQLRKLSQQPFSKQSFKIEENILQQVLSRDFKEIGTAQINNLLKIYTSCVYALDCVKSNNFSVNASQKDISPKDLWLKQHEINLKTLLTFILRFLADHHKSLDFDQHYEGILEIIFLSAAEQRGAISQENGISHADFNDSENNYPLNIFDEMSEFLEKSIIRWGKLSNPRLTVKIQQLLVNKQQIRTRI